MRPIKFKEQNVVFAKDQSQYQNLPAFREEGGGGNVISCWKFTFWERVRILFGANLWVNLMMFGKPLTPSLFTIKKSDVFIIKE